jgi:rhamnogalacturonan acetylesterase
MLKHTILILTVILLSAAMPGEKKNKPVIWLIGDSTVKNGSGKGSGGLWGWGDFLYQQFDTSGISIRNCALGGRSSRTYITEGLWDKVLAKVKPGDYIIMQFGHNDGGAVNDSSRARGTIRGTGDETEEIDNIITKKHEIVHSYGWYMRKYIEDTRTKDAIPIVCSPVPRNIWENGKVVRSTGDYAKWAEETASSENAYFINLNKIIAEKYEAIGESVVTSKFFLTEHTHTTEAGAILNAGAVAEGIRLLKGCKLKKHLFLSAP